MTKARLGRATIVEFSSGGETCFAPAREGVPLGDLMTKKRKVKVDGEEFDVELEKVDDWSVDALDAAVRSFAEANELKLGKVAQPLRAALTGRSTSPGVFDVLAVLGREESLARIRDCVA